MNPIRAAAIGLVVLMFSVVAHCAPRAYLSVKGDDANACSVLSPCRQLPRALTVVDAGGEVWILDSGNFNAVPVIINKSVTILAVPGAVGSLIAVANTSAITITGDASVRVALHNLVVTNGPGNTVGHGIFVPSGGASLAVEASEFHDLPYSGILFDSSGNLTVSNTTIRNNNDGIQVTATKALLHRVLLDAHFSMGVSISGGSVVIRDCVISKSGLYGVDVQAGKTFIDSNSFANNQNAVNVVPAAGTLYTAQNNVFAGNVNDVANGSGPFTPVSPQYR